MESLPPLSEMIAAFRRHIVAFAAIVVLGAVVSVVYALAQPRLYRTTAVIQILQPRLNDTVGAASTSGSVLQQLQIAEQRLMSRDNLLRIIDKFALYAEEPDLTQDDKVHELRKASTLEQIMDSELRWRPDYVPTAMTITVIDKDPLQAARVANEFVDNLLEQSRAQQSRQTQEALAFFSTEAAQVSAEIDRLEARLAEYKQENIDLLPDGLANLRTQQAGLRQNALELERQILELSNSVSGQANTVFARRLARTEEQKTLVDGRLNEIEALLDKAPQVERAVQNMTRELLQKTEQFTIINRNRLEAEMAQALQDSERAETFEVLETALIPEEPYAPNRRKIAIAGTLVSLSLAFVLLVLLELRNPVLRTSHQLERRLGLQPVVAIPIINAPPPPLSHRIIQVGGLILAVIIILLLL